MPDVRFGNESFSQTTGSFGLRFNTVGGWPLDEEEQRARKAFETVDSHTVEMTVEEIEVRGEDAIARARRRDTINGSIVSSFPQMFRLRRAGEAWIIREIGR